MDKWIANACEHMHANLACIIESSIVHAKGQHNLEKKKKHPC